LNNSTTKSPNFIAKTIMTTYDTVVQALQGLKERGFTLNLNIDFDKLRCHENGICLNPAEFEVVEVFRFEGDTNPSDEDVVYAIASKDGQHKGVLTSAYGMYADSVSTDMLQKLTIHQ
jgi:hypothetical protein